MDRFGQRAERLRPNLIAAALYFCTAACIAGTLLKHPQGWSGFFSGHPLADIAAFICPLGLVGAAVLVFFNSRFGYSLGLIAALIALPWFVWSELLLYQNSWISLNGPFGVEPGYREFAIFVELKILSLGLIATAIVCSSIRLLPARLMFRKRSLNQRTWPAFAAGLFVLAAWFAHSAMPYRVSVFGHPAPAEFRVLHVEKRGLSLHETCVSGYRNHQFYVRRNSRRLFQYRFDTRNVRGVMPQIAHEHVRAFIGLTELLKLHTPPAVPLRSWNAEGWYVVVNDSRLSAFTTEYGNSPPKEVAALFHEIESLAAEEEQPWTVHDVCLGFCYGPAAALGFVCPNDSCFPLALGATQCR